MQRSIMAQETNEGVAIWRPQNSRPVRLPRHQHWHGTLFQRRLWTLANDFRQQKSGAVLATRVLEAPNCATTASTSGLGLPNN